MSSVKQPDWRKLLGIVTYGELASLNVSRASIRAQVERGELISLARGVYASSGKTARLRLLPEGNLALQAAAVLAAAAPGSVISHHTAAQLHGMDLLARPEPSIAITRPPRCSHRPGRAGVHLYVTRLPMTHVGTCHGVPVTTAARTVVDMARSLDVRGGVVVADSALRERLTKKTELERVLADLRRCRGLTKAADVVQFADRRSESVLESIARVVFREFNLPPPELQVNLGGDEFVGRADFYWAKFRVVAEADGALKYDDRYAATQQLRRDRLLREAGFEVVHFTWQELLQTPEIVVARIRAAFRRSMEAGPTTRRVS